MESHLLQMRGLKLSGKANFDKFKESHLLQMRGLKQDGVTALVGLNKVASFTDAWIETCY